MLPQVEDVRPVEVDEWLRLHCHFETGDDAQTRGRFEADERGPLRFPF